MLCPANFLGTCPAIYLACPRPSLSSRTRSRSRRIPFSFPGPHPRFTRMVSFYSMASRNLYSAIKYVAVFCTKRIGVNSNEKSPQGPNRRFFPWNSQNFLWMHDLQSSPLIDRVRRATNIPMFLWNVTLFVARICWQSWQSLIVPSDAVADIPSIPAGYAHHVLTISSHNLQQRETRRRDRHPSQISLNPEARRVAQARPHPRHRCVTIMIIMRRA